MLKLVRNTLGDKKVLINCDGQYIKWDNIVQLHEIQESKGLHAANKLRKPHIKYYDNKMNVRLAAQTLSSSVSSSLLFCEELGLMKNVKPTAEFCQYMNNTFDLLNCRNKLCKGDYAFPINEETVFKAKKFLEQFKLYIEGLKFEPLTAI